MEAKDKDKRLDKMLSRYPSNIAQAVRLLGAIISRISTARLDNQEGVRLYMPTTQGASNHEDR